MCSYRWLLLTFSKMKNIEGVNKLEDKVLKAIDKLYMQMPYIYIYL